MTFYNINDIPISVYATSKIGYGKKQKIYKWICSGYDIETTTQYIKNELGKVIMSCSFPYIHQMSINDNDVLFRHCEDFPRLLRRISNELDLNYNVYAVIFIHNLGFEFQHLRWYLDHNDVDIEITNVFAKNERKPMKIELNNNIILLDSMLITNSSLEKLAKDYCHTQKLVGDLDYNKQRHCNTVLEKTKEEAYCVNDVRILSEYSKYYFDNYMNHKKISDNFLPLTSTSIVRHDLKTRFKADKNHKKYVKAIKRCYPKNWKEYSLLMDLFAGGFTHANALYINEVIRDVDSFDLKSSYPAIMLSKYFPMGAFQTISNKNNQVINTLEDMQPYLNKYCCWFRIVLKNVKAKTTHSIISHSKSYYCSNDALIDNGRIRKCSDLIIDCTELDFEIYQKFYDFEIDQVIFFRAAKRGFLPNYLRETVAKYYQLKYEIAEKIKKCNDEKEKADLKKSYAAIKSKLNSLFGCCVTRIVVDDVIYEDGKWSHSEVEDLDYLIVKDKSRNPLLPQWGVWVTSWGRYQVLDVIHKLSINGKNDCLYCDTDSTKIINYHSNRWVYDEFNAKQIVENRQFIEELNLDYDIFYNIGTFEYEGHYEEFKTLGAKRYIYMENSEWHTTIAGLPKNSLLNYCKQNNKYLPDVFKNKMIMDEAYSEKLVSYYVDVEQEMTIDDGNTAETYTVHSCLSLIPTTFSLSVVPQLLQLGALLKQKYRDPIMKEGD